MSKVFFQCFPVLLLVLAPGRVIAQGEGGRLSAYPQTDTFLSIENELDFGVVPELRQLLAEHGGAGVRAMVAAKDPRVLPARDGESMMATSYRQGFLNNYLDRMIKRSEAWTRVTTIAMSEAISTDAQRQAYLETHVRSVEPMFLNTVGIYADFTADVALFAADMPRMRKKMVAAIAEEAQRLRFSLQLYGPELEPVAVEIESIRSMLQTIDHDIAAAGDYAQAQARLKRLWIAIASGDYRGLGEAEAVGGVQRRLLAEVSPRSVFEIINDVQVSDDGVVVGRIGAQWVWISRNTRAQIDRRAVFAGFDGEGRAVFLDLMNAEGSLLFFRDGALQAEPRIPDALWKADANVVRPVRRVEVSGQGRVVALTESRAVVCEDARSFHEVFSLDSFRASADGKARAGKRGFKNHALMSIESGPAATVAIVGRSSEQAAVLVRDGRYEVLMETGDPFIGGGVVRKIEVLGLLDDAAFLMVWAGDRAFAVRFAAGAGGVAGGGEIVAPDRLCLRTERSFVHLGATLRKRYSDRLNSQSVQMIFSSPDRVVLISDGSLYAGAPDGLGVVVKPGDEVTGLGQIVRVGSATVSPNARFVAVTATFRSAQGATSDSGFCLPLDPP